jgi:hypothetical protein
MALGQYVNDRPYAASGLLAVALCSSNCSPRTPHRFRRTVASLQLDPVAEVPARWGWQN